LRKRFIRGELAKEALERIFVSSARIAVSLGVAIDLSLLKKSAGCTTLGSVVSDFRPTALSGEMFKGGKHAAEEDSCEISEVAYRSAYGSGWLRSSAGFGFSPSNSPGLGR
jgi:hypothetical protein